MICVVKYLLRSKLVSNLVSKFLNADGTDLDATPSPEC